MKKIITIIVVLIIIGFLVFTYFTRTPSAPSIEVDQATENLQATSTEKLYRIDGARSMVEFRIDEILNNKPFTAIGTTSEIAGDIILSAETLKIGTIAVNARTFKTDNSRRDGAISRAILKSENPVNEFIYFKPAPYTLSGPVDPASSTLAFTTTGDLTISGVTRQIPFAITMNFTANQVSGIATAKIKRSDFKLVIPNVPFVASVDDEFTVSAKINASETKEIEVTPLTPSTTVEVELE